MYNVKEFPASLNIDFTLNCLPLGLLAFIDEGEKENFIKCI